MIFELRNNTTIYADYKKSTLNYSSHKLSIKCAWPKQPSTLSPCQHDESLIRNLPILLPTLGINHRYKYECLLPCRWSHGAIPALCWPDCIINYRQRWKFYWAGDIHKITNLGIATTDVQFDKGKSPLMLGLQRTSSSLAKYYEGSLRKINYPTIKAFGSNYGSVYNKLADYSEVKLANEQSKPESSTNDDAIPF